MSEIVIPYAPRRLQLALHERAAQTRFFVPVCHRGFGKSVFAISEAIDAALFSKSRRPLALFVAPLRVMVKSTIWESLKFYVRSLPHTANETELHITFDESLGAGRIQLAGADSPDHLRGLHADLAILDEAALQPPSLWPEVIRPALSVRGGRAMFISTPKGRNHFYELYQRAEALPDWDRALFKASESGVLSEEELASARATMSEEAYQQEYECSWSAIQDGSIFGKEMDAAEKEGRIDTCPWNPAFPVVTSWDIGVLDATSIWFLQPIRGGAIHAIDYYESSGAGLDHYIKVLREKPFNYGEHIGPHDLAVQEFGSGQSRVETARSLGLRFTVAPKMSFDESLDTLRRLFPRIYFDRKKCARGIEALQNYRRQWNDQLRQFSQKPVHDWSSHPVDSLRSFSVGYREQHSRGSSPEFAEHAFEIFS